jgi:NAD(P)-dependent dehydrogenase (short-subunit alcohol dehydrogenase family)
MEILDGRIAVVTGAASGIGLAVTEAFAAEGMRVVMADRNEKQLESEAARLGAAGADVHPVPTDVRNPDEVDALGATAVERFGSLNVAVNNAGVVNRGTAWELTLEEWRYVLDVNLWGVINGVRSFVPLILSSAADGHVVNVASLAAVLPVDRLAPYTVAKHGLLGLSDALRLDLATIEAPVGVSVVMPGLTKTGMNPFGTVPASTVAANIVDAIRHDRPYVFTDHQSTSAVEARMHSIMAARSDVIG